MQELILGGVRSGKSALAERLARSSGVPVTYIATAQASEDSEMQQRIAHHQARRPPHWGLVEVDTDLAGALTRHARPEHCLLVDCLTLWLTHLLCTLDDPACAQAQQDFLNGLAQLPGHLIMVSNESSMGIVPLGALSRRFCDEAGRLHQAVAAQADRVILTVAGLPHVLKGDTFES